MSLNQTALQDHNRKLAAAIAAQPPLTLEGFLAQSSTVALPDPPQTNGPQQPANPTSTSAS